MFSANENLALRRHKRKVVDYVEECIPESALDEGTIVMIMEKRCNVPGCVPLETAIAIVFPRIPGPDEKMKQLIDGLDESAGGTYKTNVLKPLAEVTKEDVLDALPPSLGGRKDPILIACSVRDTLFGSIQQAVPDDDSSGRKLLAEYLIASLQNYITNDCVPPEIGVAFDEDESLILDPKPVETPKLTSDVRITDNDGISSEIKVVEDKADNNDASREIKVVECNNNNEATGNFIYKLPNDNADSLSKPSKSKELPMDRGLCSAAAWRKQPKINTGFLKSSATILNEMFEREHAPGIRRRGCPCCDPDIDLSNSLDGKIFL